MFILKYNDEIGCLDVYRESFPKGELHPSAKLHEVKCVERDCFCTSQCPKLMIGKIPRPADPNEKISLTWPLLNVLYFLCITPNVTDPIKDESKCISMARLCEYDYDTYPELNEINIEQ